MVFLCTWLKTHLFLLCFSYDLPVVKLLPNMLLYKTTYLLEKQKDMMLNCTTVITIWIERLLFFSFL